ncbi:lITAF domain-containing protein [Suncus etruscus]|uniref:lITAF domain-containing protein n=1 Tax=Suncus etruscus TaxID=109475 RepID=UPI00210FC6B4|nr:lITAF domain-containing protein [Suncus etruscus]
MATPQDTQPEDQHKDFKKIQGPGVAGSLSVNAPNPKAFSVIVASLPPKEQQKVSDSPHGPQPTQLSQPSQHSFKREPTMAYAGPFRILPRVGTPVPFHTTCPFCGNYVLTTTSSTPGLLSWVLCATFFLLGCVLGCCLLPFCMREMMDVRHKCPVCGNELYRFHRL